MEEKCCKKCGSSNINFQTVNEVKLKDKHHNFLWWVTIGWIWVPIKWLFFTLPALLIKIFSHKKQKAKNIVVTYGTCQDCGYHWKVK